VADITEITDQEFSEIMSLAREIIAATREAMNPDGFNMGCNLGSVAGAGIADHLHFHLVPRWKGDTNFMPVIADTSVISDHIMSTRDKIAEKLPC
jgi:ATP adenylyltransferase